MGSASKRRFRGITHLWRAAKAWPAYRYQTKVAPARLSELQRLADQTNAFIRNTNTALKRTAHKPPNNDIVHRLKFKRNEIAINSELMAQQLVQINRLIHQTHQQARVFKRAADREQLEELRFIARQYRAQFETLQSFYAEYEKILDHWNNSRSSGTAQ